MKKKKNSFKRLIKSRVIKDGKKWILKGGSHECSFCGDKNKLFFCDSKSHDELDLHEIHEYVQEW